MAGHTLGLYRQLRPPPPLCAVKVRLALPNGILLSGSKQTRGAKRLACISTAFGLFQKVGGGVYREAMQAIVDAWKGDPDSLRAETVQGVVEFVDLYHGEYSRRRLVTRLRQVDPVVIFREGRAMTSLPGYKRYLYQVYRIYNGSSAKTALPMKF